MAQGLTIVGLGEALFDVFADRQVVGGAPLNAAVHAHQLASTLGGSGVPVSRIGRDELGRRLLDELSARGVPTAAIQVDDRRPTGRVLVTLRGGEPDYEIVRDAAWDHIEFTDDLRRLAEGCDAVCFGTLAQRGPRSRETILQFLRHAQQAIRMFDVNLRQAFFDEGVIRQGCELATVLKLNEQEMPQVRGMLGLEDVGPSGADRPAMELRERLALDAVVLTRGALGTALYTSGGKAEGEPVRFPMHPGADSVGAGDACAAGVLVGMLLGWPPERTVALANAAGAFVASQPGATPQLPRDILRRVARA